MKQFYVIKKNVPGDYLLSSKNKIITQSLNEAHCWISFVEELSNRKSKSDVYVMCSKLPSERYIHILCER